MKAFSFFSTAMAVILPSLTSAAPVAEASGTKELISRTPGANNFLYPGGLGDPLNPWFYLQPSAKMTSRLYWLDYSKMTAGCRKHGIDAGCQPGEIDIFDVAYEDAPGHVWTLCRCRTNSKVSEEELIREVGRVPVGLRQFVRSYMAFDDGTNNAYSVSNDVVFRGNASPTVVLHETAHAVDGSNGGFHNTQAYKDAINVDTCYPDPYAKSSAAENWAQVMVITMYRTHVGEWPKQGMGMDETCIYSQVWALWAQIWPHINAGFQKSKTHPKDSEVNRY